MLTKYQQFSVQLVNSLSIEKLKINERCYYNLLNSTFWDWLSIESQPQNPEFRNNAENFHPCPSLLDNVIIVKISCVWSFIVWRPTNSVSFLMSQHQRHSGTQVDISLVLQEVKLSHPFLYTIWKKMIKNLFVHVCLFIHCSCIDAGFPAASLKKLGEN